MQLCKTWDKTEQRKTLKQSRRSEKVYEEHKEIANAQNGFQWGCSKTCHCRGYTRDSW